MSTISTTLQHATSSPLKRLIQRYPLLAFFVLAFGFTWPFLIADVLGSYGLIPFRLQSSGPLVLVSIVTGYGPAFAALIVTAVTSGKAGIRTLLHRLITWRVDVLWYVVAIFGPAALFIIPSTLYTFLGGTPQTHHPPIPWVELPLTVILLLLVHGLVNGEEIGWRGYALPRLQGKYRALTATLILGVIWTLFHLPIFFTHGSSVAGNQSGQSMLGFLASTVAEAILVTWIFNNTRGSVLLACLFHAAMNTWPTVLPAALSGPLYWLQVVLVCLVAVIVVLVFGPARLSRKPASEMVYVTDPARIDDTSLHDSE